MGGGWFWGLEMTRGCVWGGGEGRIGGEGCVPGWGCGDEGRREQSKLAHLGGNGKTNAPLAAPPPPGGARLSMRASDWNRLGSAVRLSASVEGSRVAGPSSSSTDRTARTRSGVCLGGGGVCGGFGGFCGGRGGCRSLAACGANGGGSGEGGGAAPSAPAPSTPPPTRTFDAPPHRRRHGHHPPRVEPLPPRETPPPHAPLTPRPVAADTATTLSGSSPSSSRRYSLTNPQ